MLLQFPRYNFRVQVPVGKKLEDYQRAILMVKVLNNANDVRMLEGGQTFNILRRLPPRSHFKRIQLSSIHISKQLAGSYLPIVYKQGLRILSF